MFKIILLSFFSIITSAAQEIQMDTISKSVSLPNSNFKYKQLIIPVVLIGYGFIGIENDQLKRVNTDIKVEVSEHIDKKITIDDLSQYAPAILAYALNTVGITGKKNLKQRTILLATSYVIMTTSVLGLKSLTKIERPDSSSNNSFPSGYTATAFAGAEFLWQEYKDKSIWYGITGYAVATGTGIFRIVNNRHWLTDVAVDTGIGILSTKIAYWISPFIQNKIFTPKENKSISVITPFYDGKQLGIGFLKTF
ncbi:phosphatase PAP2 family protein [Flavobacterium sp. XS2P39]|uniref:phosphatase PAP2 family protein n=1 Tax=Flavobacterium sp. XS2P39 TaxID=3401725 RepID=UPI003AB0C89F